MSFDDAEEARLDEDVYYWLQDATLEELERQMQRYFRTTDICEMPEGRVKRAIAMWRCHRIGDSGLAITEACERDLSLWQKYHARSPIPQAEMGRGLER